MKNEINFIGIKVYKSVLTMKKIMEFKIFIRKLLIYSIPIVLVLVTAILVNGAFNNGSVQNSGSTIGHRGCNRP